MFTFSKDGTPNWELDGKTLLKGETDGSSFPNGGLRATHQAGGYTVLDPTSPIFIRGDTVFIPSIFVTWRGHSVDEKTPLLRAIESASEQGKRLLGLLGFKVEGLVFNIGLEQEFFFVPRDAYLSRLDLQLTGRTVMGKMPPRGQEMSDHYMAPPYDATVKCMQEIQDECYRMGIPLKTPPPGGRPPTSTSSAPYFGPVTTQIDQNLMVMQIMTEISTKHGFACLLQEKPFQGINGSGKHNNWSVFTKCGTNLLNPGQLTRKSGNPALFPIVMAALLRSIDMHGDLMRCAVATPGNDFRLGACEAPPAIISTYLGDDVTKYLEEFKAGKVAAYKPHTMQLSAGVKAIAPFSVPSEDRNRTSPFPYGGHRFEFRAVGSSQNTSFVNTVLGALAADGFRAFADAIEQGGKPEEVAAEALNKHWNVIFNGNGYSSEWPEEASRRGLWRIDSSVEAMAKIRDPKNVALFESLGILSKEECDARAEVKFSHYIGTVEMEAGCMIDMIAQQILPAMKESGYGDMAAVGAALTSVKNKLADVHHASTNYEKATLARELRLETMIQAREACDAAEAVVPSNKWPMATYKDLLFLDYTR
eukprot:TRINITY_DN3255_c0_g2_i1.p1 TRINITY_DN3255_c0_g2~~TRINITY_DN3255_c0_g2_i1.p1  ORF type:complete len:590 (-),score=219.86 TRINITY_DN3255_c0_g2_i1:560-2329(-)